MSTLGAPPIKEKIVLDSGEMSMGWIKWFSNVAVAIAGSAVSGPTAQRPIGTPTGFSYFDTTLGFVVWWNGSIWVDADGVPA